MKTYENKGFHVTDVWLKTDFRWLKTDYQYVLIFYGHLKDIKLVKAQ